jgi:hypothetical protein
MKIYLVRVMLVLLAIVCGKNIEAQVPEKVSYQAVIRNSSTNAPIANTVVSVRVSVLKDSESGTAIFTETHTATTNAAGLITLLIGNGAAVTGSLDVIDWSTGLYWIKSETDPLGGSSYTNVGVSQLLSVPYAFYAKSASIREVTDEFSATASQSNFNLTQKPAATAKVKMYINGIRISNTAYSISEKVLTYKPVNNGSYALTVGDRIQIDYYY